MNNKNQTTKTTGIGFTGLLTIVFIVLKLCKIITWSWVWVLSPFWISIIIYILVILFVGFLVSR